jgi:OmcA/MtrC family decaheme c-type cytochrome
MQWGQAALLAAVLAGCGGGSDPAPAPTVPPPAATVQGSIAAASALAANDSASNSSAPFTVLQGAGVPAVVIASPPKVNFTVFSDGAVKTGLNNTNLRFAIAKLVPGSNGDPDQWVNYIYRTESTATAPNNVGSGPGGAPALASAKQATTDAISAAQVIYNPDGYYTYTFSTDIKDPTKTNNVVFEPGRTHRIAIQLSYTNAAGETVRVNPYFDFTVDASGNSVPVTDPSQTRKMTDVASCNSCHEKLSLHGGGRVDTQYCVMCHNPGTTDANSGHVLTLATMAHKIHSGKLLKSKLDAGKGGEDYAIWGFGSAKTDFAEVGFPQDLRNCTKCHSGANPATPQGDNWKTQPSKEACLTCHANKTGSDWDTSHLAFARSTAVWPGATPTSVAKDLPNAACAACHKPGSNIAPERVHWNQNEENAAKYKMNIESASYDAAARKVTVKYFLADPTNGNAAYNLVTADCASTTVPTCGNTTKFGNLRFYLAYQNMVGQSTAVTEFTANTNGTNSASGYAYKGSNDGSNHYSLDIVLPADSAVAVAAGTARVVSIGQVKEPRLQVKWATDPRPEAVPAAQVNIVVQNAFQEVALSGTLTPRRVIVATEKCNACHGALGTTSGSNTLAEAFHGGARNRVEACVVCHDANRMSASTVMTNGMALNESYQFKRLIHGIHGNSKRSYPFTHGSPVQGIFGKDGTLPAGGSFLADYTIRNFTPPGTPTPPVVAAGTLVPAGSTFQTIEDLIDSAARAAGYTGTRQVIENYAAEVAWPGRTANSPVGINCNVCHVDNSYKVDRGPLGAVVAKPAAAGTDPMKWLVISPKAASCTACHDSPKAIAHVTSFGAALFGDKTQAQSMQTQEICADCHSSGGFKGVDIVHGQK